MDSMPLSEAEPNREKRSLELSFETGVDWGKLSVVKECMMRRFLWHGSVCSEGLCGEKLLGCVVRNYWAVCAMWGCAC